MNSQILVDIGSRQGSDLINEARDFILQLSRYAQDPESAPDPLKRRFDVDSSLVGHVFAPVRCPVITTNM